MILQIRNMVSDRCIMVVKEEFNKLRVPFKSVKLGEVELKKDISMVSWQLIDNKLKNIGLELIEDKKISLIKKIKDVIHQLINFSDSFQEPNYSDCIKKKVNYDYAYLSNLFSRTQGITIEKFIITKKIERVKELLVYNKMRLSDIAFKLHYSSVAHLANQFKNITGLTITRFRQLRKARRQIF